MPASEQATAKARVMTMAEPLYRYMLEVGLREPEVLTRLRERTAQLPQAHYQVTPEQGGLMRLLVELMGATRALDIGTFTGYSALAMGLSMPEEAEIVSMDVSREFTHIAREAWREAGVDQRIDLIIGPAENALNMLINMGRQDSFDVALVDADKENYPVYFEKCMTLVRPGGLIAIDNTLWRGRVIDPDDRREKTSVFRSFNKALHDDDRISLAMLPMGDGFTLAMKRR